MQLAVGNTADFTGILVRQYSVPGQKYTQLLFHTSEGAMVSITRNVKLIQSLIIGKTYHVTGKIKAIGSKFFVHEPTARLVQTNVSFIKRHKLVFSLAAAVLLIGGGSASALFLNSKQTNSINVKPAATTQQKPVTKQAATTEKAQTATDTQPAQDTPAVTPAVTSAPSATTRKATSTPRTTVSASSAAQTAAPAAQPSAVSAPVAAPAQAASNGTDTTVTGNTTDPAKAQTTDSSQKGTGIDTTAANGSSATTESTPGTGSNGQVQTPAGT